MTTTWFVAVSVPQAVPTVPTCLSSFAWVAASCAALRETIRAFTPAAETVAAEAASVTVTTSLPAAS